MPGETRRMPVVFVIDPQVPKDLNTITLSYTFFGVEGAGNDTKSGFDPAPKARKWVSEDRLWLGLRRAA